MALPTRPTLNGDSDKPQSPESQNHTDFDNGEKGDSLPTLGNEIAIIRDDASQEEDFLRDWDDDGIDLKFDVMDLERYNHNGDIDHIREEVVLDGDSLAPSESDTYESFGELRSEDVINSAYGRYGDLSEKVQRMTEIIREIMTNQGKADEIAEARTKRGKKYAEVATEVDRLVLRQLNNGDKNGILIPQGDTKIFLAMVVNEFLGFGPIEPLWQDPAISEIMINGPYDVRIERNGKTQRTEGVQFRDQDHLLSVARQMLSLMGRRIDVKNPMEDGALPDGSRINVVHTALAPEGPLLTIRRFPDTVYSIKKMVELDSMTEEMAYEVGNLVHMGCSTVIAGGTGTGKALSTSTLIPTPSGMKYLGDIQVGDEVFDENSQPTKVTGYYPQEPGRECFEVSFSDGSSVVADAEHNWAFEHDGKWVVKTTREAMEMLPQGYANTPRNPLRIPVIANPVEWSQLSPEATSNPYQLGYNTGCDDVFMGNDDVLYGSVACRRKFLEGFLDGSMENRRSSILDSGLVETSTSNSGTLDSMRLLINSLGGTHVVVESYENIESKFYYTIPEGVNAKNGVYNKCVEEYDVRYIVDISHTDSVPVACITVDSPQHLYLFGESFTVTHNTSMLNALSGCIPNNDRVITIEDTPELRLNPSKHVVSMVSRPGGADGRGAIRIRDLVRNALRMRPDRIVVGEVRDSSAYDMLQALSTGHEGSLTTVHANDANGAIERISLLVAEAGEVTSDRAISLVAGAVDILIVIDRYEDGSRRISSVHEVPSHLTTVNNKDILGTIPLYVFVHDSTGLDGTVHGHYEKVNDISESLRNKHRLDKKKKLGLEELYRLSDVSL